VLLVAPAATTTAAPAATATTAAATTAASATAVTATTTAPATPTTTTTTTTAAAAAETTATTTAPAFARGTRFIYNDVASHEIVPVERFNGTAGVFVIVHFDEAKAARLSRKAIADQRHIGRRHSRLPEPGGDVFFGSLKRQIAHIEFFHRRTPSKPAAA
jgi:hypothetical protein